MPLLKKSSRVDCPVLRRLQLVQTTPNRPLDAIASESHSSSGRFIPLPPFVPCFYSLPLFIVILFFRILISVLFTKFLLLRTIQFCLTLFFRLSLICLTFRKLFFFLFCFVLFFLEGHCYCF